MTCADKLAPLAMAAVVVALDEAVAEPSAAAVRGPVTSSLASHSQVIFSGLEMAEKASVGLDEEQDVEGEQVASTARRH